MFLPFSNQSSWDSRFLNQCQSLCYQHSRFSVPGVPEPMLLSRLSQSSRVGIPRVPKSAFPALLSWKSWFPESMFSISQIDLPDFPESAFPGSWVDVPSVPELVFPAFQSLYFWVSIPTVSISCIPMLMFRHSRVDVPSAPSQLSWVVFPAFQSLCSKRSRVSITGGPRFLRWPSHINVPCFPKMTFLASLSWYSRQSIAGIPGFPRWHSRVGLPNLVFLFSQGDVLEPVSADFQSRHSLRFRVEVFYVPESMFLAIPSCYSQFSESVFPSQLPRVCIPGFPSTFPPFSRQNQHIPSVSESAFPVSQVPEPAFLVLLAF